MFNHKYLLFCTGAKCKTKEYDTRLEAEIAMHNWCNKNGVVVECTERDKHQRKYSNHQGIRFYINRI